MGQNQSSCVMQHKKKKENGVFASAVANGELEVVEAMIKEDVTVLDSTVGRAKLSPLHLAAANGRIEVDWFPYKRVDLEGALPVPLQHQFWMVYAKVYTICFENIAKHPVDICWQQLGLQQEEVKRDIADFEPIKLKQRRQKKNKDWRNATKFYTHCNMRWEYRNMFLIKEGLYFNEPVQTTSNSSQAHSIQ